MQSNSTTQPLSCRNWELYTVECRALMDELMRDHPGLSARDAHQCAAAYIDSGMLEQVAAEWDAAVDAQRLTGRIPFAVGDRVEMLRHDLWGGAYGTVEELDAGGVGHCVGVQFDGIGLIWCAPGNLVALPGATFTPVDGDDDPEPEPPTPAAAPRKPRDPRSSEERARDKAALNLALGATVVKRGNDYLVQSASRAGVVHRVGPDGSCTCEAGQAGRHCWHVAAVDLVLNESQAAA